MEEQTKDLKEVWITTVDNPFDPFTQWDRWFNFDEQKGYRTCERLARIAHCNDNNLTNMENRELADQAMVELCDFYGDKVYRLVVKGETKPW